MRRRGRFWRHGAPAAALGLATLCAPVGDAQPVPWGQTHFDGAVQDQPLPGFLRQLFARTPIRLELSPRLAGNVSGAFSGETRDVFRKIASAFDLLTYFDGRELFVYPASEAASRRFGHGRADAERIRAQAIRRGLPDAQNRLELDGDQLVATGAKPFLDQIEAISLAAPSPSLRGDIAQAELAPAPPDPPAADDPLEFRVYYLRYAWAEDTSISAGGQSVTVRGVASVLRSLVLDDGEAAKPPEDASRSMKPAAMTGLAGTGLAAQGGGKPPAPGSIAGLLGLANQAAAVAPAAPPPPEPSPRAAPAARVRVEADRRLNAIIIRDVRSRLDSYGELIHALDIEPQIVEIEATIIDVDLERLRQSGLAFGFEDSRGDAFISSPGTAPGAGGGLYLSTVVSNNTRFVASLNALETRGVTHVLSRPLVLTLSDVEAVFQNNQTFYVPVNGSLSSDLFDVSAGTTLRVTPHVARDKGQNRIRLLVSVEDGSLSTQTVGAIPVVRRSSLTTEALLVDGQSLLVGGMVSQESGSQRSKIPGVGDIPLAGALFRTAQSADDHVERLFLITPHLTAVGASAPEPAEVSSPAGQTAATPTLSPRPGDEGRR